MEKLDTRKIGSLIKQSRIKKGYTQQQLADITQLSLRSVQRIERGEVMPRQYSLDVLANKLGFTPIDVHEELNISETNAVITDQSSVNKARKLILTFGSAILLILLNGAFISQSRGFPETHFEAFLLWAGIAIAYFVFVWKIWK